MALDRSKTPTSGYCRFLRGSISCSARVRHLSARQGRLESQRLPLKTALKDARYRVEVDISTRVVGLKPGRDPGAERPTFRLCHHPPVTGNS